MTSSKEGVQVKKLLIEVPYSARYSSNKEPSSCGIHTRYKELTMNFIYLEMVKVVLATPPQNNLYEYDVRGSELDDVELSD